MLRVRSGLLRGCGAAGTGGSAGDAGGASVVAGGAGGAVGGAGLAPPQAASTSKEENASRRVVTRGRYHRIAPTTNRAAGAGRVEIAGYANPVAPRAPT